MATKTKATKAPGKTPAKAPAKAPEPKLTSPCVLSPVEALYLGKSMQKAGKNLEDAAKKRGAQAQSGERDLDLDLRLVDRPITKQASAPSPGFDRVDAKYGVGDLYIAEIAEECGADATLIDAHLDKKIARLRRVLATEKGEALLANVAELLPVKVDERVRAAGLTVTTHVPGSPGGVAAISCDPKLEVKKVRR